MRLIGKLICAVTRKHKRGVRIGREDGDGGYGDTKFEAVNFFRCPRCGAQWSRKVRNANK